MTIQIPFRSTVEPEPEPTDTRRHSRRTRLAWWALFGATIAICVVLALISSGRELPTTPMEFTSDPVVTWDHVGTAHEVDAERIVMMDNHGIRATLIDAGSGDVHWELDLKSELPEGMGSPWDVGSTAVVPGADVMVTVVASGYGQQQTVALLSIDLDSGGVVARRYFGADPLWLTGSEDVLLVSGFPSGHDSWIERVDPLTLDVMWRSAGPEYDYPYIDERPYVAHDQDWVVSATGDRFVTDVRDLDSGERMAWIRDHVEAEARELAVVDSVFVLSTWPHDGMEQRVLDSRGMTMWQPEEGEWLSVEGGSLFAWNASGPDLTVTRLDPLTGVPLWSQPVASPSHFSDLHVEHGWVVTHSQDQGRWSFHDLDTGALVHDVPGDTTGTIRAVGAETFVLSIFDDLVVEDPGAFHGYLISTGELVWELPMEPGDWMSSLGVNWVLVNAWDGVSHGLS